MTTEDLISYIKKQISNNVPRELIISRLIQVGWRTEDINEGFAVVDKMESDKIEAQKEPKKDDVFSSVGIEIEESLNGKEELIPNLISKTEATPTFTISPTSEIKIPEKYQQKEENIPEIKSAETPIQEKPKPELVVEPVSMPISQNETSDIEQPMPTEIPAFNIVEDKKSYQIKDLPKIAMISSYSRDVESMQSFDGMRIPKEEKKTTDSNLTTKRHSNKWILFVVLIIILLGVAFVFANNSFNIRDISFSLIKKDPRALLLDNSSTLSSLKSYKTKTSVEISMPSFANISAGLVSGEAVISDDKDTLSIDTIGLINKNTNALMSDNFITIKSSILDNYITTDVKNNGTSLFISIPDLSQIMGDNAPEPIVVRVNEDQASMISSILPNEIQDKFTKVNLYRILSRSISSFLDNDTLDIYNQFINDAVVTEKGEENIEGVNTYHYVINTDKQLSKKLLNKVFENFTYNLSDEDRINISEITGSTNISSFEVWVGKNDNNIYQYRVVLAVPLSKVLNFEDKSIGDNMVNVDWTTTYYDFDVTNNIFMPEQFVVIDKFTKIMSEVQMKDDVSSFRQFATNMKNAEGSYGTKANGSGSCTSPTSGSLFSPTGHEKSALESVSSISLLLNKILEKTYGTATCYSTPSAWSLSVPISDNYDPFSPTAGEYQSYFCIDSTGAAKDLSTLPTSVVCK